MIKRILEFIFFTFIFIIYIECDIGNIVFRQDSSGKVVFTFYGLFSYLIDPLINSFLWNWELLRHNYILWIIIYLNLIYFEIF